MESRRIHYIDWLRVFAVLLLFPFHTGRVFNAGEPFYVKSAFLSRFVSEVLSFIDIWHMPLLFLLAGASTYLAFRKRGAGQYARERVNRLLLPLAFGIFVLIPPQTWLGGRFNSGYTASFWHYLVSADFLVFNIRDGGDYYGGFGIGHLWFILFLFLISIVALPLIGAMRTERGTRFTQGFARTLAHPAGWLLAAFILMLAENLPELVGINFGYYFVIFLLGYVAMSDEWFAERSEHYRWLAIAAGFALAGFSVLTGDLRNSLPDPSFGRTGLTLLLFGSVWLVIIGAIGLGRRYLDKPSNALSYLGEASYPVYILHQTVIVVLAWYVVQMPGPWASQWFVLLILSLTVTFGLYEVVRRIPALRSLFGLRSTTRAVPGVTA
jgi:peptidoglycan/LPS O-acetylase OafA/YrhL